MWKTEGRRIALAGTVVLVGALVLSWAGALADVPQKTPGASAGGDATGKPRIEFGAREHDFGHNESGKDLKTTFGFKNAGDGVLVIEKVKGG
jgi:hypothetical protein